MIDLKMVTNCFVHMADRPRSEGLIYISRSFNAMAGTLPPEWSGSTCTCCDKWVLTTNLDLSAREVAPKYKQLWTVEEMFRSMKSLLETRPIFYKCDETIRGHVFCLFLALVLRKELQDRLESKG